MRILIIDNHDSFVHNISWLLESVRRAGVSFGLEWDIVSCDDIDSGAVPAYDAMILSPGPGIPSEAGNLKGITEEFAGCIPVLGICLGMQAIAEFYGASLRQLEFPRHGHKSILCGIDADDPVVGGLAGRSPAVGRYHSWVVEQSTLPDCLAATSFDEDGNIMSLRHRELPVFGTQFHPESIITDCGIEIMTAFLRQVRNL